MNNPDPVNAPGTDIPAEPNNPRQLSDHKVNGLPDGLLIEVLDKPGQGGANHKYQISWADPADRTGHSQMHMLVGFQNGPIKEAGVNGVTQEALLAIVIDRLRGFQSGQFSSRDNAIALTHVEEALLWLKKRTYERIARGVEGTNVK